MNLSCQDFHLLYLSLFSAPPANLCFFSLTLFHITGLAACVSAVHEPPFVHLYQLCHLESCTETKQLAPVASSLRWPGPSLGCVEPPTPTHPPTQLISEH